VLSPKEPHLPLSVVYRAPARLPPLSPPGQPSATASVASAATLLLTDAVYTVTGTTLVGNLSLPSGFTFERYRGARRRVVLCTVTVTNLSGVCSRKSFTSPLEANTLVEDRRPVVGQPAASPVLYVAGPGRLLENGASAVAAKKTRSRVVLVLGSIAILPAAVIFFVSRAGRHKRSPTQPD
jgi:hypothetical protein